MIGSLVTCGVAPIPGGFIVWVCEPRIRPATTTAASVFSLLSSLVSSLFSDCLLMGCCADMIMEAADIPYEGSKIASLMAVVLTIVSTHSTINLGDSVNICGDCLCVVVIPRTFSEDSEVCAYGTGLVYVSTQAIHPLLCDFETSSPNFDGHGRDRCRFEFLSNQCLSHRRPSHRRLSHRRPFHLTVDHLTTGPRSTSSVTA